MRLDSPRPDGTTRRDHLEVAEAATGEKLFEEPEVPPEAGHIWIWFWDLNTGRGNTGWGPAPLGHAEIEAWARLYQTGPTPWEIQTLRQMDNTYLAAHSALQQKKNNAETL